MMHSGKHWRLPATAPENVPLMAGTSTRWQVYFLCTNCAAALFFFASFIQLASCSQVIDKPLQRQGHPRCMKTSRRQDIHLNDICSLGLAAENIPSFSAFVQMTEISASPKPHMA